MFVLSLVLDIHTLPDSSEYSQLLENFDLIFNIISNLKCQEDHKVKARALKRDLYLSIVAGYQFIEKTTIFKTKII